MSDLEETSIENQLILSLFSISSAFERRQLPPLTLIGEPTYAWDGNGGEERVGVSELKGSYVDPSNVETAPSTPTLAQLLLQNPPLHFC